MQKNTFTEHILRVVAVVGLIAVLLLGAWGIIQLAFYIPTLVSNLTGAVATKTAAKESLVLSLPSSITSNKSFNLSWTHKDKDIAGQYSYAASYSCADGVSVNTTLPNGSLQSVPCDTPFNYTGATSVLPVTVVSSKATPVTFTVSATKLSSGAITTTGSAKTTVALAKKTSSSTTTTKKSTTSTKYVPASKTANLYGYSDLQVRMLSTQSTVRSGSQISMQFVIENVGTNVVPAGWTFNASLPYSGGYNYESPTQQALYPGDKIVYTLGFTAQGNTAQITPNGGCDGWTYPCNPGTPVYGGPGTCNANGPCTIPGYAPNLYGYTQPVSNTLTASVTVDSYNLVWEQNESNNYASVSYQVY